MITHTATRLGNGEVLLKTIWEGEDERVTIHTSCLTQEQAAKLCEELMAASDRFKTHQSLSQEQADAVRDAMKAAKADYRLSPLDFVYNLHRKIDRSGESP